MSARDSLRSKDTSMLKVKGKNIFHANTTQKRDKVAILLQIK